MRRTRRANAPWNANFAQAAKIGDAAMAFLSPWKCRSQFRREKTARWRPEREKPSPRKSDENLVRWARPSTGHGGERADTQEKQHYFHTAPQMFEGREHGLSSTCSTKMPREAPTASCVEISRMRESRCAIMRPATFDEAISTTRASSKPISTAGKLKSAHQAAVNFATKLRCGVFGRYPDIVP